MDWTDQKMLKVQNIPPQEMWALPSDCLTHPKVHLVWKGPNIVQGNLQQHAIEFFFVDVGRSKKAAFLWFQQRLIFLNPPLVTDYPPCSPSLTLPAARWGVLTLKSDISEPDTRKRKNLSIWVWLLGLLLTSQNATRSLQIHLKNATFFGLHEIEQVGACTKAKNCKLAPPHYTWQHASLEWMGFWIGFYLDAVFAFHAKAGMCCI